MRGALVADAAPGTRGDTSPRPVQARVVVAVASVITVAFMGSVIVTPLYPLYQRKLGFSEITLTLIYAVYVVGNVAALLLFGQLSDQLGRKRIALPSLALAAIAAVLFFFADSTTWLFVGRLLIGLAVGVASGTGTAWLGELYGADRRAHATLAAVSANLTGIAVGPVVGGLLAQYAPGPLRLPFVAYALAVAAVAIAVARTPEARQGRAPALREVQVHVRIGVSHDRLGAFATPAMTAFVIFALGGLYFALIPSIVVRDLHEQNVALGGLLVFEFAAVAATTMLVGRRLRPAAAMTDGLLILLPAVALVVAAQAASSMALLVCATALAGAALGLGYRGSLQVVNEIAPQDRRAEVVSTYFMACFIGNSLPVIGVGVLTAYTAPLVASSTFAATIAALSLAALAWHHLGHRDLDALAEP